MPTSADTGFTFHTRSDWGVIVAGIIVAIVGEAIGMHFLVQQWSRIAAWILTAMDLYGVLWLIRDHQSLKRERTTIDEDGLHIRFGRRWTADVPLSDIASIEPLSGEWKRRPGALKISMLDDPRLLIRLRKPVSALGLGVIKRQIDTIALLPDDPEGFESALRSVLH